MRVFLCTEPVAGWRLLKSIVIFNRKLRGLGVGHFYEVMNSLDHTADRGGILKDYGVVHFLNAEGVEGALLNGGSVDAALDLGDFDFCHFEWKVLAVKHFIDRETAVLSNLSG